MLVCVRADFDDDLTGGQVEDACARIDRSLRDRFEVLDEIFVQPVSRADEDMQERVRSQVRTRLADE